MGNKNKQEEVLEETNNEFVMTGEDIAVAVAKLARGMEALDKSRLKRKTIVVLLQDATKLPKQKIEYVLNALSELENIYLK